MASAPPIALTINGSDCSAGAGLQADLKTFSRLGVHGLTVVTSVMAGTPLEVVGLHGIAANVVSEQTRLLLDSFPVKAIKTGVLHSSAHVMAVADVLTDCGVPVVVDADMLTTTGESLLSQDAVEAYKDLLFPCATIITPNLDEARYLLGGEYGHCGEPVDVCAKLLHESYGCSVLVTGFHDEGRDASVDCLAHEGRLDRYESPWVAVPYAHGTGCTFTAALTAGLARGHSLVEAVATAKSFIAQALRDSYQWAAPGGALMFLNHLSGEVFGAD